MEADLYFGEKVDLLSFQIHLCIVQPLPGTLPYQYVGFFSMYPKRPSALPEPTHHLNPDLSKVLLAHF